MSEEENLYYSSIGDLLWIPGPDKEVGAQTARFARNDSEWLGDELRWNDGEANYPATCQFAGVWFAGAGLTISSMIFLAMLRLTAHAESFTRH